MLSNLRTPFTYLFSPSLVAKPHDWGAHIDVVGFSVLKGSGMLELLRIIRIIRIIHTVLP